MAQQPPEPSKTESISASPSAPATLPAISLPKGGGALRGMSESFNVDLVTGTCSFSVPLHLSKARSNFEPQVSLSYDSAAGNGDFGLGWQFASPSIVRKTDKGLPRYRDATDGADEDVFILAGSEDLVPVLVPSGRGSEWEQPAPAMMRVDRVHYAVQRYRPRVESGRFDHVEKWTGVAGGDSHWRVTSRDNVTTVYGTDDGSRVFDPQDPSRVFRWLIAASWDDRGNAMLYEYKREDSEGVDLTCAHETNRTPLTRGVERHLKRIKYGNRVPRMLQPDLACQDWLFEVVFDYGEHDPVRPTSKEVNPWVCRLDPFSSSRSGFDVRSYRLCQRILMFHHFPDEQEIGKDYLVSSTNFVYLSHPQRGRAIGSLVASITQVGYIRNNNGTYIKKSKPPLEFEYTQPVLSDAVHTVDPEALQNLPQGISGNYQFVDLDGEGIAGILSSEAGSLFYKPNLGKAHFGPVETLETQPNLVDGKQQMLPLGGDGRICLTQFSSLYPGFFKRDGCSWHPFVAFRSLPNLQWKDPNLRFVDLNGDGFADILLTKDDVFTWYQSWAEDGFGPGSCWSPPSDEEKGPRLVLADGEQAIYLCDMSGDGLADLVRIRNSEVCYWPNQGYGSFGAKVTMDNSPLLDHCDSFDQRRARLADIDGSGTADLIYLSTHGIHVYFNEAGNSFSDVQRLPSPFPPTDSLTSVDVFDLLGTGTACLVWSSPNEQNRQMRYMDLMGGQKPHLLLSQKNNLGSEVRFSYLSSTHFYLADKRAGRPWATRLHFPVQVVHRVETLDYIAGNRFTQRFSYHHGCFDGFEREFRGFGLVEQQDTEEFAVLSADPNLSSAKNISRESHVPPVLTKTWFHTGVLADTTRLSRQFETEYFHEPLLTRAENEAMLLDDTVLPTSVRVGGTHVAFELSAEENREACRALKGSILRQEIYSLDDSSAQNRPYTVSERNYTIEFLQPQSINIRGVFSTHARETLDFHYERKTYAVGGQEVFDPRVSHEIILEADDWGNTVKSASITYGRRHCHDDRNALLTNEDHEKQKKILATYTHNFYTNAVLTGDSYRAPKAYESRIFELVNIKPRCKFPDITNVFRFREMAEYIANLSKGKYDLPYEDLDSAGATKHHPYRRLLKHIRTLYSQDDLGGPLPLGRLESLALPYEAYSMAFTPGLISQVFVDHGKMRPEEIDAIFSDEAGYVHSGHRANWWVPTGRILYSPNPTSTPQQELSYARSHFFLPCRQRSPFHTPELPTETILTYDQYDLLIQESTDPLGNRTTIGQRDTADPTRPLAQNGQDYRVLQPRLIMDPNGNRTAVAFDELGMVVGIAKMGKPEEKGTVGDSFAQFEPILTDEAVREYMRSPLSNANSLLGTATTRFIYDFLAYYRSRDSPAPEPPVAATLARETHVADLAVGHVSRIHHSFSYSDGFGREIQGKTQAEPGVLPAPDTAGSLKPFANSKYLTTKTSKPVDRWVGTGWQVFNNKGKVVRQYEPFFTDTPRFELAVQVGVSPIMFYDPLQRVVGTLNPDHSFTKTVIDVWKQEVWDTNDTVLITNPENDLHLGDFFRRLPPDYYLPTWYTQRRHGNAVEQDAARKCAVHANTPTMYFFDPLGHRFLSVAGNAMQLSTATKPTRSYHATRTKFDVEGNELEIFDAKNRSVMKYTYTMLSVEILVEGMDMGRRWHLQDVMGKPAFSWDTRGQQFRVHCDQLRRPVETYLRHDGDTQEVLVDRSVYGETLAHPEAHNSRGRETQVFDQAGAISYIYDFKGNTLSSTRELAADYKTTLDWSSNPPPHLETGPYTASTAYDAFDRAIQITSPDSSITLLQYNEAKLLEKVDANLLGESQSTPFVANIDYDAKGERTFIQYGNGVNTAYEYDRLTFRLTRLKTTRNLNIFPDDCKQPVPPGWPGCQVQNLSYAYDAKGNITHIQDDAQQAIFFRNQRVDPSNDFTYDALYRLIEATGREDVGQTGGSPYTAALPAPVDLPGNGQSMATYLEQYLYDAVGNLLGVQHRGSDAAQPGWARRYEYDLPSLLNPNERGNRLGSTAVGNSIETYRYDGNEGLHGNMTAMPHLRSLRWDFMDRLHATVKQNVSSGGTPETTYYVYDREGHRVRKVTERHAGAGQQPTKLNERIYMGNYETYRTYSGDGTLSLARGTLHIMDGEKRVALVEMRTSGEEPNVPPRLIRYQIGNHQNSVVIELDDQGRIITYEEYTPFGSVTYSGTHSQAETPKRYRYTGMERDEESGFSYHESRYYAPWLGRWTSCDPQALLSPKAKPVLEADRTPGDTAAPEKTKAGEQHGHSPRAVSPEEYSVLVQNVYCYAFNNPVGLSDVTGRAPPPPDTIQSLSQLVETSVNSLGNFLIIHHSQHLETFEAVIGEAQGAEILKGSGEPFQHITQLEQGIAGVTSRRDALVDVLNRLRALGPEGARAAAALKDAFKPLLDASANFLRAAADTRSIVQMIRSSSSGLATRLSGIGFNRGAGSMTQQLGGRMSLIPEEISEANPGLVARLTDSLRQLPGNLQAQAGRYRDMMTAAGASLSAYAATVRQMATQVGTGFLKRSAGYIERALPYLESLGQGLLEVGSRLISVPLLIIPKELLENPSGGSRVEA